MRRVGATVGSGGAPFGFSPGLWYHDLVAMAAAETYHLPDYDYSYYNGFYREGPKGAPGVTQIRRSGLVNLLGDLIQVRLSILGGFIHSSCYMGCP